MRRDPLKTIMTIVLVVVIGATIVLAMMAESDKSLLNDLNTNFEFSDHCFRYAQCRMPGCSNEPTVEISLHYTASADRHSDMTIPNNANFWCSDDIVKRTQTSYVKDEYILISPDGNGDYKATKEHDWYETKRYTGGSFHSIDFSGEYCNDHKDQAVSMLQEELKTAITSNFICLWGYTLFPYNLVVITIIMVVLIQLRGMRLTLENGLKNGKELKQEKFEVTREYTQPVKISGIVLVVLLIISVVVRLRSDLEIVGYIAMSANLLSIFAAFFFAFRLTTVLNIKRTNKLIQKFKKNTTT